MSKDAYYFSHDANSRHDPKCLKLQAKYGMRGYGVFWVVIETLREHTDYKMPIKDIDAIDMDCKGNANEVIMYCIEIGLLESDGVCFYAPSLLRRMEHLDGIRAKRKKAAEERWSKLSKVKESKVKESSMHSKCNANAMQMKPLLSPFGLRLSKAFSVCNYFPVPKEKDIIKIQGAWEKLYSDRDIEREILKADAWIPVNGKRTKLSFISTWLENSKPKPSAVAIPHSKENDLGFYDGDDLTAEERAGFPKDHPGYKPLKDKK